MKPEELAKLTPEEKPIMIAELCGKIVVRGPFTPAEVDLGKVLFSRDAVEHCRKAYPFGTWINLVPDYLNDLNAMHEAEQVLTLRQRIIYLKTLGTQVAASSNSSLETALWNGTTATAAQRADAFLLTLG